MGLGQLEALQDRAVDRACLRGDASGYAQTCAHSLEILWARPLTQGCSVRCSDPLSYLPLRMILLLPILNKERECSEILLISVFSWPTLLLACFQPCSFLVFVHHVTEFAEQMQPEPGMRTIASKTLRLSLWRTRQLCTVCRYVQSLGECSLLLLAGCLLPQAIIIVNIIIMTIVIAAGLIDAPSLNQMLA